MRPPLPPRGALEIVVVVLVLVTAIARAGANGGITPGLAAGGVPLSADVEVVGRILGRPTDELRDPTNRLIFIQRWETLCLGARYTPKGELLALDAWFDVARVCPEADSQSRVLGRGGETIGFGSSRGDVKRAFGYRPERVLRAARFTVLVYDAEGVAFYIREGRDRDQFGRDRDEHVDVITVFPPNTSTSVWMPSAWGRR